jgi:hypothetical protein
MMEDADGLAKEALVHLARCPACRGEHARLRAVLAALAADVHTQAERPAAFWLRQHERIAARRDARRTRGIAWRWAWTPALIAAGLLFALWTRESPPPARDANADHELLAAVQRSIAAEAPAALQPAALLVTEIEASATRGGRAHSAQQGGQR